MRKKYHEASVKRNTNLFVTSVTLVTSLIVIYWLLYFRGDMSLSVPLRTTLNHWVLLPLALCRYYKPEWLPYVLIIWFAYTAIVINLTFRNFFGGILTVECLTEEEDYFI